MRQRYRGQLEDLIEKVQVYEGLLHDIQLNAEVAMNRDRMKNIISAICDWSYAHRVGNGELTEKEQARVVRRAFDKLAEGKW